MEKAREVAIEVINEFEELLNRKGIKIPSEDREENSEEASIYGQEYYELEDNITQIIKESILNILKDSLEAK